MFEIVDGRRTTDDDGRTPEHEYTISSPCEPNGSGELKYSETCLSGHFYLSLVGNPVFEIPDKWRRKQVHSSSPEDS